MSHFCKKYTTCPICKDTGKYTKQTGITTLSSQYENASSTHVTNTQKAETYSRISANMHFSTLPDRCNKYSKHINLATSYGNYADVLENNYLEITEEFINPQETLKLALQDLKQDQWQKIIPALIKLIHISRIQPELLDSNMSYINRTLCSLLRNTRPHVVRTTCQVAMEFYKTVQYTQRPEFDELASLLLLKSTHTNKGIRNDAQSALNTMVIHLPPTTCIQILASEHGAGHKNPLIRATVSKLLYNIINIIGVECLLLNPSLKDIRKKIFTMCAKFLLDGNNETRNDTKKALKTLMSHQDFDTLFYQDIDWKTINSIEKQLVTLKYN